MRLTIIGSRTISDSKVIFKAIEDCVTKHGGKDNLCVLAGGALGVDDWAERWAKANSVNFILFKPYFMLDSSAEYTPRHFFIRNKQMIQNADHVLAIWDGVSKGTDSGIKFALKNNKPTSVHIVHIKGVSDNKTETSEPRSSDTGRSD